MTSMKGTMRRSPAAASAALLLVVALGITACSSNSAVPSSSATGGRYPLTIDNCGTDVTFDSAPKRVMLLESAPVTILDGIDVFDTVISRAGSYPHEYFSEELAEKVDDVPALTDEIDASGHLMISQEEVVAQTPDLVLGLPDGISREVLADAGINVLTQELYCPNSTTDATFGTLYDEITRYGMVFDRESEADALISDLAQRVSAVEERVADSVPETAVVLYPTAGGGTTYAYGSASMVQPQLEALGLTNIFEDRDERVFEVQTETLVEADPDVIVLLYQGSENGVADVISAIPGSDRMSAVVHDRVITHLFNFTEPASPLTVTGLEMLADELADR